MGSVRSGIPKGLDPLTVTQYVGITISDAGGRIWVVADAKKVVRSPDGLSLADLNNDNDLLAAESGSGLQNISAPTAPTEQRPLILPPAPLHNPARLHIVLHRLPAL